MKIAFLGVLMFLSSSLSWSDSSVADTASASRLITLLDPIQTMSGDFSQIQRDAQGALLSESSGTFDVARPGKLRWQTEEPFSQLLISDGEKLWLYDADLEQVTVSRVDDQLNQTPAVIFSGDVSAINSQFAVSSDAANHFILRPVIDEGYFQQLELTFKNELLVAMSILDGFGQQTLFSFSQVRSNPKLSPEQFIFVPPEGTDVLIHD